MVFDAVILAGGRASRLGGVSKAALVRGSETLLELALDATAGARRVVVVGDAATDVRYLLTRESPMFGGPVAALSAGLTALDGDASPYVLVLACDMPDVARAVAALLAIAPTGDGTIALDATGREQYLAAIYQRVSINRRLTGMTVEGASMRELVRDLTLDRVTVPPGTTDDVDTWQDAGNLGVTMKEATP